MKLTQKIKPTVATLFALSICSCGDLVNEPEYPDFQEETKKEHLFERQERQHQRLDEMCEHERQWVYSTGAIDAIEFRLFRRRNLAPIYRTPGERQSGVETWCVCEESLKANGFIR